jgi:pimeloyl-ACP methyl ester carboxylesterase
MRQNLLEYLEKTVVTCHYPITLSGDKPGALNRWLAKSIGVDGLLPEEMEPRVGTGGRILPERDLGVLSQEELETNWRYYFADEPFFLGEQRTFYEYVHFYKLFTRGADQYLYGLCNLFCSQANEVHFFIYAVSPIKLWINGELVFISRFDYFIRPYRLIVRLREGDNIILVEQPAIKNHHGRAVSPAEFSIRIHPCDFPVSNNFIDQWVVNDLKSRLVIFPDRAFYPVEAAIKMLILPGYFTEKSTEPVKVTVSNTIQSLHKELMVEPGQEFTVEIDPQFTGLLWVQAEMPACAPEWVGVSKKTDIYLFRGGFKAARDGLVQRAREAGVFDEPVIQNFIRTTEIIDMDTGFFKASHELILSEYYYQILAKYGEFETRVNSFAGDPSDGLFDVYKDNAFIFMDSPVDEGYFTYQISLPDNYTAAKKYPLVIFLFYGHGLSQYPDLVLERYPERQHFSEAIIVSAPARGGLNRDYINQSNYYKMIARIQEEFSIDRERIYLIGSCTGGIAAAGLALKAPQIFAAVVIAWGTPRLDLNDPDYDYLKNMGQTMTYHLLNIDDYSFNFARLLNTQRYFPKSKCWKFRDISHIEIDLMFDFRRLIHELIQVRADQYPKVIEFTVDEPVYNRSSWLVVNRIDDLHRKGRITARIVSPGRIEIKTENIGRFSIYVNRDAMGLEPEVILDINGVEGRIQVDALGWIDTGLNGTGLLLKFHSLTPEDFRQVYDRVGIAEDLLGIKQIYAGKCLLLKPEISPGADQTLVKRLLKLLQLPMKERTRNYRYDSCMENKMIPSDFQHTNFIFVVDARNISPMQQEILDAVGLSPGRDGVDYGNQQYSGAYFALIKCSNPDISGYFTLAVIYNEDSMVEELIHFWNAFDYENFFFSDAVLYHQGLYHSFRNESGQYFLQSGRLHA